MLGTTGHDGVIAVVIKNVATRVVCANTLGVALGVALGESGGATWRIQHTANSKTRLEEAGKAFAWLARSYERLVELANVLAVTPFTGAQMQATVDRVMPVPRDDRDHSRLEAERAKVVQLFDTAVGIERVRGVVRSAAMAVAQKFSRHSDVRLTIHTYGRHLDVEDVREGIARSFTSTTSPGLDCKTSGRRLGVTTGGERNCARRKPPVPSNDSSGAR